MNNPGETVKKIKKPEWLNLKNGIRYGVMTAALLGLAPAFAQISSQSGSYYDKLVHLNEIIASNPLGSYVLNTLNQLSHIFSSAIPQFHPEDVPMVHIMEYFHILSIVGGPLEHMVENIFSSKREARKLIGVEPLRKKEKPQHVFIGPTDVVSDLVQQLYENKPKEKNKPIVAIHTQEGIPARYGQEINYHFKAINPLSLLDTFPTKDDRDYIEFAGIDRADEITIVCFNPDNAIFYGNQNRTDVSPDFVSSLIRNIPSEKLKGKKINVILNETKLLAGTVPIEQELMTLAEKNEFTLNLIKPEELVITKIKSEIEDIKKIGKKKIALVGQGEQDQDKLMLKKFTDAIKKISKDITVEFINNEQAMKGEFGVHDIYVCYGDTDLGTSSLAEAVTEKLSGISDSKILSLVERNKALKEYKRIEGVSPISIYQMVIDKILEGRK